MSDQALANTLIAWADDQLILGHRNSEWCGYAPILEEDIAFANIAIDELGHARAWYELAAGLLGEDLERFPDAMIFQRDGEDFRNVHMASLPNDDWAHTLMRQHLLDRFEMIVLEQLAAHDDARLAGVAAKLINEERYHLRHTRAWLPRLGLGTEESQRRMQAALDRLWPFVFQCFVAIPEGDERLNQIIAGMSDSYQALVVEELGAAGLHVPESTQPYAADRQQSSADTLALVEEMQSVARAFPDGSW